MREPCTLATLDDSIYLVTWSTANQQYIESTENLPLGSRIYPSYLFSSCPSRPCRSSCPTRPYRASHTASFTYFSRMSDDGDTHLDSWPKPLPIDYPQRQGEGESDDISFYFKSHLVNAKLYSVLLPTKSHYKLQARPQIGMEQIYFRILLRSLNYVCDQTLARFARHFTSKCSGAK